MILDVRTLFITNFLYTFFIGISFAITQTSFSGQVRASIKTLSNAMFLMAIGWIFLGLRGIIPIFHSVLWGNLASILGLAELVNTILVFDGKKTTRKTLYPIAIFFNVVNIYYLVGNDLPSVRIAIISLSTAVLSLYLVYVIFHKPIFNSKIRFWGGIVFIFFAIISLIRAFDAFFINFGEYTLLSNTWLQTYYLVIIFLAIFIMTFAFSLMCTHRFSDELKKQTIVDPITNLYNRNGIRHFLQSKIEESVKNGHPLCIAVFDINEFRKFNDQYGLEAGDKALQTMANILLSHISSDTIAGRLGGDEFLLILPQTDLLTATKKAQDISSEIENKSFDFNQQRLTFTISTGVALLNPEFPDANKLIKNAHHELFKIRTLSDDAYGT